MSFFEPLKKIAAVGLLLSLVGQGCTKAPTTGELQARKPVMLTVWGVVDDVDAYTSAFSAYRKAHPNVSFDYKRMRLEEYEQALLNGFADDRGPDIFMIHNTWITKYLPRTVPMPATVNMGYAIVSGGGMQQTVTYEVRQESHISNRQFKNDYADVAIKDAMRIVNVGTADKPNYQEKVVAMPLTIDTMAMYYNKDLLNTAGVPNPPENWVQFQEQVKKLTKLDEKREILQSAAGIGTGSNVERSSDLLSVLMMQNGTQMLKDDGGLLYNQIPPALDGQRDEPPAYQAIDFYTSFADPNKETYTWNAKQPNSLDAFIQGKAAFFFGYSYQYATIKARAPKLNLGIAKLPQIENNPVRNFANYWVWAVAKKSKAADTAWNFLNFMQQPEQAKVIVDKVKRPGARKSLLPAQLEDERVGVFASQVLTAESWYKGRDAQTMEEAFKTLIDTVVKGEVDIPKAVKFSIDTIGQTMY